MKGGLNKEVSALAVLIILAIPSILHGTEIAGKYTAIYQSREDRDGEKASVFDNYLRLDINKLFHPDISVHAYGKYGHEFNNEFSDGDVYYLYLQYRAFEGGTDLRLGRFPLEAHRFLTVDGLNATFRAAGIIGVSAFAGQPRYLEIDPDRFHREFRDTGDFIFGSKVFLQGIEGLRAHISYSRENGGDVYRELLGAGAGKDFKLKVFDTDMRISSDVLADYNTDKSTLHKLTGRLYFSFDKKVRIILAADRYNVKEDFPEGRELIMSLLSTGREDRLSYTIFYDITRNWAVYQASTFTHLEMPDGEWHEGTIIKGGINGNFLKEAGLDFGVGVYNFDSFVAKASGVTAEIKWHLSGKWTFEGGVEAVFFNTPFRDSKTATTVTGEVKYSPNRRMNVAVFAEQSDNPEYTSDFRTGMRVDYNFSFGLFEGRQGMHLK